MTRARISVGMGFVFALALAVPASAQGGADLELSSVVVTPSYVKQKGTVQVRATIKNVGSADFSGTTNVAYWFCQGDVAEADLKAPRCSPMNLQPPAGGKNPGMVGPLKAGGSVELVGEQVLTGYLKPARIAAWVNDKSTPAANNTKATAFEVERPTVVAADLELKNAKLSRAEKTSHDVQLELQLQQGEIKQGPVEPVDVVGTFCREGKCTEVLRTTVTPTWTKGPFFHSANVKVPFQLQPYYLPNQEWAGDVDVIISKRKGFDVDATNNQARLPAPVTACPGNKMKQSGKKKVGKKTITLFTCLQ